MANLSKVLVDIPADKGVHVKSAGAKGEKYVYQYTRYFRNADGKPRNRAKAIGKVDVENGKMIPNANYYEMFNLTPEMPDISVLAACCTCGFLRHCSPAVNLPQKPRFMGCCEPELLRSFSSMEFAR